MKKVLLIAALAVFGFGISNAQEAGFKAGIVGALPMGDLGDISSFGIGLDAAYLWEVGDGFLAGAATGYHHFMGKDVDYGFGSVKLNFAYIPVAGAARYSVSDEFFVGADLGLALAQGDFDGSGFYYRPKVGYNLDAIAITASYAGVSVDNGGGSGSFASILVGVEYAF